MFTIEPPPATHGRDDGAGAEEHPRGVDGHRALPFLERRLLDAASAPDASVVDEDVEPAVEALGRLHRARPVVLAGHVEAEEARVAAGSADGLFDGLALGLEHVAEHDLGALPGEKPRLLRPHPARTAADQ